ncbi:DUF2027 domain-containing protein [Rapidithrix thailandica]|uniref:DUF2027 domain-containing protein n=1 Tax=Rapidithrix thailandica TaxID=413964 RepID=A0AAW9S870_9BACT
MNIGDKVRSIRGQEEGTIVRFISSTEVEVEIEDGFQIPFMVRDLVLISKDEQAFFDDKPTTVSNTPKPQTTSAFSSKGIFVGMHHKNDKLLEVFLVNNTDFQIPYTFGEEESQNYKAIAAGVLKAKSYQQVHELNLDKFERWPALVFQGLFFKAGPTQYRDPFVQRLKFRASNFYKSKAEIPQLKKDGYVFQLDASGKPPQPLDKEKLREQMLSGKKQEESEFQIRSIKKNKGLTQTIDLHAENFPDAPKDKDKLLSFQIDQFESALDEAIIAGVDEITFVHGVGNGVLRLEIQRRLGQNPQVEYFKDAQKEKFGYGATLAKIL